MAGVFASTAWANHTDLVSEGPSRPDLMSQKSAGVLAEETKDFMKDRSLDMVKERTGRR